jgi:hypothetical protein
VAGRPKLPNSELLARRWNVPSLGVVRVVRASPALLAAIDREWPAARRPTDLYDWSWRRIASSSFETFAVVVGPASEAIALWATAIKRLLELPGGLAYRLDFLEVAPRHRGPPGVVGVFAFGAIAARALECGASRLLLGALPGARRYYDELGGIQALARGWKVAPGLLPYEFARAVLQAGKELIDGLADESEES